MRFSLLALFGWVLIASGLLGTMVGLKHLVADGVLTRTVPPEGESSEQKQKAAQIAQEALSLTIRAGTGGMASFVIGCGLLILNWRQKRREMRSEQQKNRGAGVG